jgi:hypothetical protein
MRHLSFLGVLFAISMGVLAADEANSSAGWKRFWSREAGAGEAVVDQGVTRENKPALRVTHRGQNDWSLEGPSAIKVNPGDIVELSVWVKVKEGQASLSAVTRTRDGKVIDWTYGAQTTRGEQDWAILRARIVTPANVTSLLPRLTGNGPVALWAQELSIIRAGNVAALRDPKMPKQVQLSNAAIELTFDTQNATFSVTDRRNRRTWMQFPIHEDLLVKSAKVGDGLDLALLNVASGMELSAKVRLEGPEVIVSLNSAGPMKNALAFPQPFISEAGTYLVVPMNEGMAYPVEDESIGPMRLIAYGGHGICMGFFGATDGKAGYMGILETSDDASIRIARRETKLYIAPEWDSQKGEFGYERKIRYVFFDQGGHVAMAKRYRAHAKSAGLLKTFNEKVKERPGVDKLIGAANVWCWDRDPVSIVKEMEAAGIEKILWSNQASPRAIEEMNKLGVLTGRYDIYQDVMDPARFSELRWTHPDWTTAAWPKDLMLNAKGDWIRGWGVESKAGGMISCGVTCDKEAIKYADERIPADLKTHAYGARFIDTTTASPWRECYSPDHPMTRSESRHYKMELLRLVSEKYKLVCGSETGHEAAVPYTDYFEGMLSIGPYRVPDSGRNMQKIWTEVPEVISKFQVGYRYRLPLWELVYHDCLAAHWYWGDYNNKLPAVWDKRDQFNALYGTAPMFMFNRDLWGKEKERFVQSYKATCPIAREVGYSEMIDHRILSADWSIQQTVFANGVKVTVDFGKGGIKVER